MSATFKRRKIVLKNYKNKREISVDYRNLLLYILYDLLCKSNLCYGN